MNSFDEAAELADAYNWPRQASELRQGSYPLRFGKEVGQTIVLFLTTWPFGVKPHEEKENRAHAKQLVKLRCLLAGICTGRLK